MPCQHVNLLNDALAEWLFELAGNRTQTTGNRHLTPVLYSNVPATPARRRLMTRLPLFVLPGMFLVALCLPAVAQESAPPAHVAYVDGRAVLEHDTTSEDVEPNLPLDTGDRLRTMQGRAEV